MAIKILVVFNDEAGAHKGWEIAYLGEFDGLSHACGCIREGKVKVSPESGRVLLALINQRGEKLRMCEDREAFEKLLSYLKKHPNWLPGEITALTA